MIVSRFVVLACLFLSVRPVLAETAALYSQGDFASVPLGKLPAGWRDLGVERSSPNWGIDGRGGLRVFWKDEQGLLVYEGLLANGENGAAMADGEIVARFKKTPDDAVSFGLAGRVKDARNYYAVRFSGETRIELVKVVDGKEEILAEWVTRRRYPADGDWRLSLSFNGPRITGRVSDAEGIEQARVDALDEGGFSSGMAGLLASNFAAAQSFAIHAPFSAKLTQAQIEEKNAAAAGSRDYAVLKPAADIATLNTPFEKLAESYDVIVAGAGSGGWAAAVQAARMGAKVLLVEETDWIGGQMAAAAVTSMDEEGCWEKFPVRQRGLYREFHESMVNLYYTMNKDPFRAYYAWPEQLEGGYEPKMVRAMLYAFIEQVRQQGGVLDLAVGTRITKVARKGNVVEGVTAESDGKSRDIQSRVLVEATEYGDILPLAGARYRVGNVKSDKLDPASLVQHHTWVGVIKEYPEGVPDRLRIKSPPPGYDSKKYKGSQLWGPVIWGGAGKDIKGPRSYRVLFAWRGMADSDSPMAGVPTEERHTQCGLNGGRQDYPVTVGSVEDAAARRVAEREGIYRTLSEIYYFQNELGLPWAVADDEGFDTPYQRREMAKRDLRPDLLPIALQLPQWPYVRECRRGIGLYTLRASDLQRFEKARHFSTAVAMGDYFMDLDHGDTGHAVEVDLDSGEAPRGGGPFQVPFEVFIPEKIDGLVLAEKNISQSRLVNGATRLQPITMLDGQAAGAIAALAVKEGVQPRQVNPIAVQAALLAAGSNLIQRWYEDVKWGTPLWQATQLLSLHKVLDPPGPFVKDRELSMGGGQFWKPEEPLSAGDFAMAVARLAELGGRTVAAPPSSAPTWADADKALSVIDPQWKTRVKELAISNSQPLTRGDFALASAAVLKASARPPLLTDSP